ncbi:hypothetical protein [Arthrobacter globiformis]|uniref:hypothetical protein n=1 Tax=Arthrobacter globiformis TaxID=1665 RepID=UPI002793BCBB|nr:hypothetical protein [Arthrobacter globiformis]MDQ0616666.1 ABC-type nitrate/sulfonate/bicarbonate transport system permease component [Arthrobacter globiformis]
MSLDTRTTSTTIVLAPGRKGGGSFLDTKWGERLIAVFVPIALLGVWEVLSRTGLLDDRFFPPPTGIVSRVRLHARFR